ncbi:hypothetical protein A9K71_26265 [Mesorhizobium sp. WSM3873]|nr:hypothetical protein A9K71_26265 [Mesorhizobium sp. WSM3873]
MLAPIDRIGLRAARPCAAAGQGNRLIGAADSDIGSTAAAGRSQRHRGDSRRTGALMRMARV